MRNNKISRTQMMMIIAAGYSIMSLFAFPGDVAAIAGRGSLYAVMIMWVLTAISTAAILGLGIRFPGQTVVEYGQSILGRIPGLLVLLTLAVFNFLIAALVIENYSRVVHTMFLPRTPEVAVLLVTVLAAAYVGNLGLQALGRTSELMIPIAYILFLLVIIMSITRMDLIQLRPSLIEGWPAVGRGIYSVFYPFLGPQIVYLLTPFLDVSPRKAVTWTAAGIALNLILVTGIFFVVIGVLGVTTPQEIRFPAIFTIQLLFLPGFFVENIGYVVAISWTILMTLYLAIQLWAQALVVGRVIPALEKHQSLLIVGYGGLIIGIRFFFAPERDLNPLFTNLISPAGLLLSVVLPLLLLAVAALRGIRGPLRDRPDIGTPRKPKVVKVRR